MANNKIIVLGSSSLSTRAFSQSYGVARGNIRLVNIKDSDYNCLSKEEIKSQILELKEKFNVKQCWLDPEIIINNPKMLEEVCTECNISLNSHFALNGEETAEQRSNTLGVIKKALSTMTGKKQLPVVMA
ncbi:MAG: hypothetical protein CFH44_00284 [Proteobacteria bacterium]|nr:MAG: hypothetical protein CFH44_00284 [Pseudomonadota bacterium]|tara:strand:- start:1641 stop:2030 length:390 start_codon:yes stop_codon:yes gene_type:complete